MMKTEINYLLDLLTCQFLKVIFFNCPHKASPIPILIFRVPPLPIFHLTESFQIYLTLRNFCQFSYPDPARRGATCHLTPSRVSHLTFGLRVPSPANQSPHYASPAPYYAQPAPHHANPAPYYAQPAPHVSQPQTSIGTVFVPLSS